MAKVIIGIHGLGNKPPAEVLSSWWKLAIEEGMRKLGRGEAVPHFELVYWADVLYNYPLNERITDKDDPYYLDEKYTIGQVAWAAEDHNLRQKLLNFIEDQLDKLILNEDLTINYSGITDAIIRRFFRDLDAYYEEECLDADNQPCSARGLIRARLVDTLNKYRGEEIVLIGHSMGSIIAYDVLTFLVPDIEVHTFITMGSPLGFPVVQGKIAAEWHTKRLVPPKLKTPPGVKKNWYNFADLRDRIALVYKLEANYRANWRGVAPMDFVIQNDYHNGQEPNPHKSFGYLRAGPFSELLLQLLTERRPNFFRNLSLKLRNIRIKS